MFYKIFKYNLIIKYYYYKNTIMKNRRCMGFNNNGNKCRTRIDNDLSYFCCESHKSYNFDEIVNQCPICLYKIRPNDIRILRCKHAHHRGCLEEWLFSKTQDFAIPNKEDIENYCCPICKMCIPTQKKKLKFKKYNNLIFQLQNKT